MPYYNVVRLMSKDPDAVVGAAVAAGGAAGISLQAINQGLNTLAVCINILAGLLGLYVVWARVRRARRLNKDLDASKVEGK